MHPVSTNAYTNLAYLIQWVAFEQVASLHPIEEEIRYKFSYRNLTETYPLDGPPGATFAVLSSHSFLLSFFQCYLPHNLQAARGIVF